MTKLPRWQPNDKVTGEDLNFILGILDTADVIARHSATNSGVTGGDLNPTTPNTTGSLTPGGAPTVVRGLTGSYGIDNFSQSHTAYVLLTWTPNPISDFINRYDIYYHKGSDPTLYNLSVGGDVNSIRVNNLFPGNTYSFAAQAHDTANRSSSWCSEVDVSISLDADPPAIPPTLTATSTAGGVYLNWTEVGSDGISNDLKQYVIAVSLDGGANYTVFPKTGPGDSFFYTPTTPNQGTVFFKIATIDWTGNVSDYTSPVSAKVGTIQGPVLIENGTSINTEVLRLGRVNPIGTGTQPNYGGILFFSGGPAAAATYDSDNSDPIAMARYNVSSNSSELRMGIGDDSGSASDAFAVGTMGFTTFSSWSEKHRFDAAGQYTSFGGITVTTGGLTITAGGAVITAGNLTLTAGNLLFSAASAKIIPGATSLLFRNNADSATNISILDAGGVTLRSSLSIPATAWGSVISSLYGSTMVKLDEQSTSSGASVTLTIPIWAREVEIEWGGYCDNASAQGLMAQFASDTAGNYDYQVTVVINVTTTNVAPVIAATEGQVGRLTPTNASARVEAGTIWISNPDNGMPVGGTRKNWRFMTGAFDADTAATAVFESGHGQWRSVAGPLTSVKLFPANLGNLVNFRAIAYGRP
jgi:hypothetical protein